jgi:hypothetical protein
MGTKNSKLKSKIWGYPMMARVYTDDPSIVFIFNGWFWTPARREDVEDVVVPVVTVVAEGKYICSNVTLKEALIDYKEKCSKTT